MTQWTQDALDALPEKDGFRLRGLEMTRLETFTDAAFAFALTLLVISFDPPTNVQELTASLRGIPAFLVSATLLMLFWWGHHEWSRRFGLDDGPTVLLSCLLVFTVLVYVVPLRFMASVFFLWIQQLTGLPLSRGDASIGSAMDLNTMFAVYGAGFMAMAISLALLRAYALRRRGDLLLSDHEVRETAAEVGIWAILAACGGLSVLIAVLFPSSQTGAPGSAYMLLPILIPIYMRWTNKRFASA